MGLKLHNTFTRTKEEFVPVEKGKVKFYMCGPTVYDYIHIGNARAFIAGDVLRRFMKYIGYDVTYVLNLTDIDDKIIQRSQKEGVSTESITEKFSKAFFEDIDTLGIEKADAYPRATEHVEEIIVLIKRLIGQASAYQVGGDVYYDVSKFANYGKLSGKNIDDLRAGARVAVDEKKRNPHDFALWKNQKPGEPAWESPWGMGRPGWHIECSAMSMKYLGESFDIHAGGQDLIFPHHENEIAQSEGATKQKFVKYWLHNGFLQIEGEKMAKSLGNFRTVREIVKIYPGRVLRLFFLQKHYRSPIDLTDQGLQAAASASARLKIFYDKLNKVLGTIGNIRKEIDPKTLSKSETEFFDSFEKMKSALAEAMSDDLNTPVAISVLFDMVRETNKLLSRDDLTENEKMLLVYSKKNFDDFNSFLGLIDSKEESVDSKMVDALVTLLIELRNELRAKKEWELSDKIRDQLNAMGVVLEDKGRETEWRLK
ncbi:MAG: cysteine--tRNA ligase [Caldithrix sp.]|nr:MAG: cysteine--tRNA ligase [Caldithrix sp.]